MTRTGAAPDFSVVIPTRNRRRRLLRTLEGVLRQEEVSLEVIIVDEGSSDGTADAVAQLADPRIVQIRHTTAKGVAAARNAGIAAASGVWVAFLDDDDLWAPAKLRKQLDAATAESAVLGWSWAVHVDDMGRALSIDEGPPPGELSQRLRARNVVPAGASNVIVRRSVLERVGGFRTDLMHFADWDLWKRLATTGPGAVVREPLVAYVQHGTNMRAGDSHLFAEELRRLDASGGGATGADPDRADLLRWMANGHRLEGRPLRAAVVHARIAWETRGREEALDAVRTAFRLPDSRDRAVRVVAVEPPAWLVDYPGFFDFGEVALTSGGPGLPPPTGWRGRVLFYALLLRMRVSPRRAGAAIVLHRLAEAPTAGPRLDAPLPVALFEQQVRGLARFFELVPASELRHAIGRRRRGDRFPVAITFDDDLETHLRLAAPVLRRAKATATFYLTGATLAGPFSFWWQRLDRALDRGMRLDDPLLPDLREAALRVAVWGGGPVDAVGEAVRTLPRSDRDALSEALLPRAGEDPPGIGLSPDGVRSLAAEFELGFHTRHHDSMTALDDAALVHALRDGRMELEQRAGRPLQTIAYPHGDADQRVAQAAAAAGFRSGFTTRLEAMTQSSDPLLVGRVDAGQHRWPRLGTVLLRAMRSA